MTVLEALVGDACRGTDFPIIQIDGIGHNVATVPLPMGGEPEVSDQRIQRLA